jgi:hypothetical protein
MWPWAECGLALFVHFPFSENIYSFKYFRNSFKLSNFVTIHIKFIKIQNNFCLNPLEYIYAIDLTKSIFVHHYLITNPNYPNLEVINLKHIYKIKY